MVWHQQHAGLDVFETVLHANLTVDSVLINFGSQFVLQEALDRAGALEPELTVEEAVAAARQHKDKFLVTIEAKSEARYERVIDALNALAKADIANVTFAVAGAEPF